ncbi:MAG: uridine kinase [Candidatus Poriferisodalaceae bacterium]|jgi:uridine kinase|tara:strand:+ start:13726 stop:14352 length:627 start_codon:yes stop_codon:yes gene_type:complete
MERNPKVSVLVGIAGGSCSGKTTLARNLLIKFPNSSALLAFDDYYHDLSEMPVSARSRVNYDHPDSLDTQLFVTHLEALGKGNSIEVPIYDFATHTRPGGTHQLQPADVVIVDGVLLLALPECREFLDLTVFVDAPEEIRLERRLERDVSERGRDEAGVRSQFTSSVSPMHQLLVEPSQQYADLVVSHPFQLDAVTELVCDRIEAATS